jgi:Mrp family chromosome partitioning ATPase
MNIWEEVYSKSKDGKSAPADAQTDQNHYQQQNRLVLSESLGDPPKPACPGFPEETYYQSSKPQPANQSVLNQDPMPEPQPEPQATTKPAKARFIPRIPGKLTTPYPALLSKMRYSLSDSWANIMLETKQNVQTLLVCGSARKEGATLISFHLAMFLSKEYSMKVLYVDTNLNHTAIPKIQNLPGVYSFVADKKDLASLVVQTEYPGLYLLPSGSGTIGKNIGSNMLSREPIESLMQFCRTHFDMTIIDGQPLVSSPVMIEFARVVDMTLLVCRYGYSRHEVSRLAIDKLQKFGITSVGVIFNDRKFPVPQKLYKLMG